MSLYAFDQALYAQYGQICGVDEAGRGPLAGPVYAAAVILDPDHPVTGVQDSKRLSAKKREQLSTEIQQKAIAWAIASASCTEIDQLNILQATLLAMRRAVEALTTSANLILVDGNADPGFSIPTRLVVKGDATSASIAAASILAKVARDQCLLDLDACYPQYAFAQHKGYGTTLHYERLDLHGPCPAHRRTFLKKWEAVRGGA